MFELKNISKIDTSFIVAMIILCIIGAINVFSTTFFPERVPSGFFTNQVIFYLIGFAFFFIITVVDYKKLKNSYIVTGVYLLTVALLIAVLLFGDYAFQAKRWIVIGNFTIQPSEFAKISIILIAAYSFSKESKNRFEKIINIYKKNKGGFKKGINKVIKSKPFLQFLLGLFALISIVGLVMLQKSLGNSVIITLIYLSILYFAVSPGLKFSLYVLIALLSINISFNFLNFSSIYQNLGIAESVKVDFLLIGLSVVIILLLNRYLSVKLGIALILFLSFLPSFAILNFTYNNVLLPYQRNRIETFLSPDPNEALSDNYNREQAILAVGSGGLIGRGLLNGNVTNLGLLPFAFTDFAFASYGEQFGFIGSIFLFILYLFLIFKIVIIAQNTKDGFGKLIAYGVGVMIALNTIQHIGMNIGLLPITGVPLPLISYGGSAVLTIFIGLGFVQSIYINNLDENIEVINLKDKF